MRREKWSHSGFFLYFFFSSCMQAAWAGAEKKLWKEHRSCPLTVAREMRWTRIAHRRGFKHAESRVWKHWDHEQKGGEPHGDITLRWWCAFPLTPPSVMKPLKCLEQRSSPQALVAPLDANGTPGMARHVGPGLSMDLAMQHIGSSCGGSSSNGLWPGPGPPASS